MAAGYLANWGEWLSISVRCTSKANLVSLVNQHNSQCHQAAPAMFTISDAIYLADQSHSRVYVAYTSHNPFSCLFESLFKKSYDTKRLARFMSSQSINLFMYFFRYIIYL